MKRVSPWFRALVFAAAAGVGRAQAQVSLGATAIGRDRLTTLQGSHLSTTFDMPELVERIQLTRVNERITSLSRREATLTPGEKAEFDVLQQPPTQLLKLLAQRASWNDERACDTRLRLLGALIRAADLARGRIDGTIDDIPFDAGHAAELESLRAHPANPFLASLRRKGALGTLSALERVQLEAHEKFPDDPIEAAVYLELMRSEAALHVDRFSDPVRS